MKDGNFYLKNYPVEYSLPKYLEIDMPKIEEQITELEKSFELKEINKTVDLFLKTLDIFCLDLLEKLFNNRGIPRESFFKITSCIEKAYRYYFIENDKKWIKILRDYINLTSLRYEELEEEVYTRIPEYIQEFKLVLDNIKKTDYKRSFYLELEENKNL